jgi:tetratricopeptide (TPR) repeat protein
MKKKSITLITILMLSMVLFGGKTIDQKIADLEGKLQTVPGKGKIEILNQLALEFRQKLPEKSIEYGLQALELSQELKDKKGEVTALGNMSRGYMIIGENKKSLEYAQKSLTLSEQCGDKKGFSDSLSDMGNVYHELSNYDKALEYYQKSLKIKKDIGDKKGTANTLSNIGLIYIYLSNYEKTLEYYLNALEIEEEIGNKQSIAGSYNNVGNVYWYLSHYKKALEFYQKALKIYMEMGDRDGIASSLGNIGNTYINLKSYNNALEYFQEALTIFEEMGNKNKIGIALMNIGEVYDQLGHYHMALKNLRESLNIFRTIGEKWGTAYSLSKIGEIYSKLHQHDHALSHLNKGLKIAKEIKTNDIIRDSYKRFSEMYSAAGNYKKALDYYKRFSGVKDTIFNEKSSKQIAEMQTRYDTLKKEKEIEVLKKNTEILEKYNKIQKITRNTFIIGFIMVSIFLVLLFKKYLYLFSFWKKQKYIGQFRLMEQIGSGGMGTIYKAHSIRDKTETVAIKVLKQELFKDENNRKRFKQEGAIIDRLEHPNIIKIIERGEYKERLFIVMEYLQGKTLDVKIDEEGQMGLSDCLHIMKQISDALLLIHIKEIIHRDLKPSNIMLVERGGDSNFVKLLDFGLAKMKFQTKLTRTGIMVGTLNYMAPEQLANSDYSSASDIYSLGVTFYEIITGKLAFPGETATDIMKQVLNKTPVEPHRFRPDIPGLLNDLIMKMIEKRKESRPNISMIFENLQMLQDMTA